MRFGMPLERTLYYRRQIPEKYIHVYEDGRLVATEIKWTTIRETIEDSWTFEHVDPRLLVAMDAAVGEQLERFDKPLHGIVTKGETHSGRVTNEEVRQLIERRHAHGKKESTEAN